MKVIGIRAVWLRSCRLMKNERVGTVWAGTGEAGLGGAANYLDIDVMLYVICK